MAGGTWTPLANSAPNTIALMLLLPDGTVMGADGGGANWYRLSPDIHGSYVNGTWTTLAPMHDTRLWFSSDVLTDGRVFVAGGEYGSGGSTAEVYDPSSDSWTLAPASGQTFSDSISKILPNGSVLVAPVYASPSGGTVIYDPVSNTWSSGGMLFRGPWQAEASWVRLPDDSILTIDPYGTNSERYIPSSNTWINDGNVPVPIYDPVGSELGGALLLPAGRSFFLGGSGHTALYTPTGNSSPGAWVAGPDIPGGLTTPDAPAAMMVNGVILCAVGPALYMDGSGTTVYPSPTTFYEYDPVANSFTSVNGPTGFIDNVPPYATMMLDLPDGTVLYSDFSSQLYVYRPAGAPLASGKPAISSITQNSDGSYHVTGTLFNGISEGAVYGDDAQMNGNYPLVRMTNSIGNVYYARTFNWSSTGVMTGNKPVTTEFELPANAPVGTYWLVVTANGISSDAVQFTASHPLRITPITGFAANGPIGGPFNVTARGFALTNAGTSSLNWQLANASSWLSASSSSGTLTPGGPATLVTVSLSSTASNLPAGTYYATVWFTNLTEGFGQSRQFKVPPPQLVQNNGFETGDFTAWNLAGNTSSVFVDNGTVISPNSGQYAAALGPPGSLGFLSQTLPTVTGQIYSLSLWLDSPNVAIPNEFLVEWNGKTNLDWVNIPAIGWTNLQFFVRAAAPGTILQFGFQNDLNYFGLDDVTVVAIPPTAFQSVTKTNSTVKFTWNALPGLMYQVQYSTNLTQGNWTNSGAIISATNSMATASDAIGPDRQRFYRLIVLE